MAGDRPARAPPLGGVVVAKKVDTNNKKKIGDRGLTKPIVYV